MFASTSLKGNKVATIDAGTQVARNFEILRVDKVCFLAGTLSLNMLLILDCHFLSATG